MFNRPLNRIQPKGPAHAYKSYSIVRPKATHFRIVTCAEALEICTALASETEMCPEKHCGPHHHGWKVQCDMSTVIGEQQAKYIAFKSGRKYKATRADSLITFVFPPGQKCFAEHTRALEREPLYVVRGGDWRGNPRRVPTVQRRGDDWVDDFANNQIKVRERVERG